MAYDNKRKYQPRGGNDRPPPVFTELAKFDHWADVEGSEKRARLGWGTMDNNPRVSVFLNHPEYERGAGILAVGFYPEGFESMMSHIHRVLREGKRATHVSAEVMANTTDENGRVTGKERKATYYVGVDKEGMAWHSVWQDGKPRVVFRFTGNAYLNLKIVDEPGGEPRVLSTTSNPEEYSRVTAMGYFRAMEKAMIQHMGVQKPPREGGGAPASETQSTAKAAKPKDDFDDIGY